jgi:hypothetical protein
MRHDMLMQDVVGQRPVVIDHSLGSGQVDEIVGAVAADDLVKGRAAPACAPRSCQNPQPNALDRATSLSDGIGSLHVRAARTETSECMASDF